MEYITVAVLGLFDLWAALPPALIMKLDPAPTALVVAVTSSLGVVITVYLASTFRQWLARKFGRSSFVGARTERFMVKYGTPGLGLLSPLVLGPVLTCAGAVALGAPPRQLVAYGVAGVCLWSLGIYILLVTRAAGGLPHY